MTQDDQWEPRGKYRAYLAKINEILGEEQRTVRDIYYALEARGFPEELAGHGWDFKYRFVKRAVKKGRRHGFIDPEKIIDTSRRAENTQEESNGDPEEYVRAMVRRTEHNYFENFWENQPTYVEVWLEKAALSSVFEPICRDHNVRLEATRGDWSDSKVYEATQRLSERIKEGKDVKILYFGDYNPSGLHAPVSIQETMEYYGIEFWFRDFGDSATEGYFDIWPLDEPMWYEDVDGTIEFDRVSLTLDEIERFDLPENPTPSSTDKDKTLRDRFMEFASGGRDVNIELNALKEYHRDYLEERVEDAITQHIDEDARREIEEQMEEKQDVIGDVIDVDYDTLTEELE